MATQAGLRLGLRLQHQLLGRMTLMAVAAGHIGGEMRSLLPQFMAALMTTQAHRALSFRTGEMFRAESNLGQLPRWTAGVIARCAVTADTVERGMFGVEDGLHLRSAIGVVAEQARFITFQTGIGPGKLSRIVIAVRRVTTGTDHRLARGARLDRMRGFMAVKTGLRLGVSLLNELLGGVALMAAVAGQLGGKVRTFPPVIDLI